MTAEMGLVPSFMKDVASTPTNPNWFEIELKTRGPDKDSLSLLLCVGFQFTSTLASLLITPLLLIIPILTLSLLLI